MLLLVIIIYGLSLSLDLFSHSKLYLALITTIPIILGLWLISRLAETNRTPFDFAEGESELVSGFNTEFSAGGFAVIFIAEYGSIYFLRFISSLIFCPSRSFVPIAAIARLFLFF